jgi:hypothetical protein
MSSRVIPYSLEDKVVSLGAGGKVVNQLHHPWNLDRAGFLQAAHFLAHLYIWPRHCLAHHPSASPYIKPPAKEAGSGPQVTTESKASAVLLLLPTVAMLTLQCYPNIHLYQQSWPQPWSRADTGLKRILFPCLQYLVKIARQRRTQAELMT